MPTYEFRCSNGHEFERFYRTISSSEHIVPCPTCGQRADRLISGGAGLVFKGSGFYETDYARKDHASHAATDANHHEHHHATDTAKGDGAAPAAAGGDGGGAAATSASGAKAPAGTPVAGPAKPAAGAPARDASGSARTPGTSSKNPD